MRLLHQALLFSLGFLFVHNSILAQSRKTSCPSLEISTSHQTIFEGDVITLKASIASKKATFRWSLSAGEIISGQGSETIQIKTENLGGDYLTATVEVKGLPANCASTKTESFAIRIVCPSLKLDIPREPVIEGHPAILIARVEGGRANLATFHWMVSAGKIRSGQATSMIEVDTRKLGGVGILAAVELGGVASVCRTNEVVAVRIAKKGMKKSH